MARHEKVDAVELKGDVLGIEDSIEILGNEVVALRGELDDLKKRIIRLEKKRQ